MIIYRLLLVLLLLLPSVIAVDSVPPGSGACCVPPYLSDSLNIIFEGVSSADDCSADYLYVESCYDNGALVGGAGDEGCCCDIDDFPVTFGSTAEGGLVTRPFCEADPLRRFTGASSGVDCSTACFSGISYYVVSGQITDQNNEPLEGITVRAVDQDVTVISDSDGYYSFGLSPGISSGIQLFETIVPSDYDQNCLSDAKQRNIAGDTVLDFSLLCEELPDDCEATWDVGDWGDCYLFNGGYIRSRSVTQTNACSDISNKPDLYTSSGCEDLQITETCGNGVIDGNEQCDIGIAPGQYNLGGVISSTQPFCSTIFGPGYVGSVGCTSLCTFDLNSCETECGSTCEADECSNPNCAYVCNDHPVCSSCDEPVSFLPGFLEASNSRDVYDLYDFITNTQADFSYGVRYFLGTADAQIEWDLEQFCVANILGVDVSYCEENGETNTCEPNTKQSFSILGTTQKEYLFEDILEPNTNYCFNVCARTAEGVTCAYSEDQLPCFSTGDQACMEPPVSGRNCEYIIPSIGDEGYHPAGCSSYPADDGENRRTSLELEAFTCDLSGSLGVEEVCIETVYDSSSSDPTKQGAMCVPAVSCTSCNGMLGLFSSYNLPFDNLFCNDLEFNPERGEPIPGFGGFNTEVGQCFVEKTPTPFSYFDTCDQVTSCYDYLSRGSCEQDPCFKFTDVTATSNGLVSSAVVGCSWQELEEIGVETGVGVCVPNTIEDQDCGACDENSPLGFCDQTTCELYGESCYYKESLNNVEQSLLLSSNSRTSPLPSCLNQNEVACYLYDSEVDCLGGAQSSVHVFYEHKNSVEEFLEPDRRIYGTNRQLTQSNDLFGFGDCSWDATKNLCFKDSNDYVGNSIGVVLAEDDCFGSSSLDCYKDVTAPTTTLLLREAEQTDAGLLSRYGTLELLELDFSVSDDYAATEQIETYVTFVPQACIDNGFVPASCSDEITCTSLPQNIDEYYANNCFVYPQFTLSDLVDEDLREELIRDGRNIMLFFSEDEARNLEEVQQVDVYIDNTAPEINDFDYTIETFEIFEDFFLSTLEFSFTVSEAGLCTAEVYNLGTNSIPPLGSFTFTVESTPYTFSEEVINLEDGSYVVQVTCTDDVSNEAYFESDIIFVNGDVSILPIEPVGHIYSSYTEALLEIHTPREATCRFDEVEVTYDNARRDFITVLEGDTYIHTAALSGSESDFTSGFYQYFVHCSFADGDVVEGKPGDLLSMVIDQEPPVVTLLHDSFGNYVEYDELFDTWEQERNMRFSCDDENVLTPGNLNFGCEGIYYCLSDNPALDLSTFAENPVNSNCDDNTVLFKDNFETTSIDLELDFERDAFTYVYYVAEDKGGNRGLAQRVRTNIRNTDFVPATVVVS